MGRKGPDWQAQWKPLLEKREKWRTPSCFGQYSKTTGVILSTLKWPTRRGCPTLRFFEGWDSTVVSRVGFSLTPAAPSFIECKDDPHHPPFSQRARKGWSTQRVVNLQGRIGEDYGPTIHKAVSEVLGLNANKRGANL